MCSEGRLIVPLRRALEHPGIPDNPGYNACRRLLPDASAARWNAGRHGNMGRPALQTARTSPGKHDGPTPQKCKKAATNCRAASCGQWTGPGLNRRHQDFQSCALPTELPVRIFQCCGRPRIARSCAGGLPPEEMVLAFPASTFKAAPVPRSQLGASVNKPWWGTVGQPSRPAGSPGWLRRLTPD